MSSIGQYLKDTQIELRHVAWPTRTQTIVYTILVAAISIAVAAYLGLFDLIFTSGLTTFVTNLQNTAPAAVVQATTTPAITVSTSTVTATSSTR